MTHGDGGKGSARRKENVQAILNNWDLIFGKKPDTLEPQQTKEEHGVREDTPTMPELPKQ
jgi:hypothetical protein